MYFNLLYRFLFLMGVAIGLAWVGCGVSGGRGGGVVKWGGVGVARISCLY